MEEDLQCTPPEIQKKSLQTIFEILPQKSVEKYNRQYEIFMERCNKHRIKKYSENVLLAYFSDLFNEYSPSTMWSYYSMVKATLSAKHDVDISKYKKLTDFLKQKGKNNISKKSKTLSQDEILKFLINALDNIYLMMKICDVFGIAGALRNEELLNFKVSEIDHKDTILVVRVAKTKTKRPRLFVITSEFEGKVNSIELFNIYLALRPKQTPHDRLFLTYRNGKCTVQPVGIHTFGSVPSKIASYLHLDEPLLYTEHCFCRTSATLFANAGGSKENLKRHGGWKSDTIAESYVEESVLNKTKIARTILGEVQTGNIVDKDISTKNIEIVNIDNIPQTFSVQTPSTSGINFYNASGCNFTFKITNNN